MGIEQIVTTSKPLSTIQGEAKLDNVRNIKLSFLSILQIKKTTLSEILG